MKRFTPWNIIQDVCTGEDEGFPGRVTQTAVTVHRRWDDVLRPSVRPSAGERHCPAHVARVYSIPGWCRQWSHWLTHVSQTWIQLRTSGMLWISDWRHQIRLTGAGIQVWRGGGVPRDTICCLIRIRVCNAATYTTEPQYNASWMSNFS